MTLTSVLVATRGRPTLLLDMLVTLKETVSHLPIELIVVADADYESYKLAIHTMFEWTPNPCIPGPWKAYVLYNQTRLGASGSWNRAASVSTGDLLFPLANDERPHPHWLDRALAAHAGLGGYGCVGLNDLMHDPTLFVNKLFFDRKYCSDVFGGTVCIPPYKHLWHDVEMWERVKRAGHYVYVPDAVVEHLHPSAQKREADALDNENMSHWDADEALFKQRKAANFPDDFEASVR